MSLGYWLGGDPADDSHIPHWVYEYEVCEVCEKADTWTQNYDFAEYGIEECECVECDKCYEFKHIHDYSQHAEICDGCIDACEDQTKDSKVKKETKKYEQ